MELKQLKKHMRVTTEHDDDVIEEYRNWADNEIMKNTEIKEEHLEHFKHDMDYRKLLVLLTTHFYENRLVVESVNVSKEFLEYGAGNSLMDLYFKYKDWEKDNEV